LKIIANTLSDGCKFDEWNKQLKMIILFGEGCTCGASRRTPRSLQNRHAVKLREEMTGNSSILEASFEEIMCRNR
jgi:hypothetical protein